ncbi:MAG: hypothetical protein J6U87_01835, partial [Clostridia bacterium]|nr:hypothetical protein [Clostridia bacterium]
MSTTGTTYTLEQYKTDKQRELEAKKKRQQERAEINYQKLMKYLPNQMDGASDGVLASAKISASNALANNLAAAETEYTSGMNEVLNNYRIEKQAEADKQYERERAEQDSVFNNAMTTIDSQTWNTTDDLEKYVTGLKGKVSDAQYGELTNRLNFYRNNPEQQAADEEYYKTHNEDGARKALAKVNTRDDIEIGGVLMDMQPGNNFKINGYKVELGDRVATSDLPSDVVENTKDGQLFEYNGQLYYRSGF